MGAIGIRKIHQKKTSQYTCIVMYFDVFCVFQWAPITILPPLGWGVVVVGKHSLPGF